MAAALGADVLWEPQAGGHSQAVTFAMHACQQRGLSTILTIPGDIPHHRGGRGRYHGATVPACTGGTVPNRDDLGTNAIVLSPPDCLPLRFGYDSNGICVWRLNGIWRSKSVVCHVWL